MSDAALDQPGNIGSAEAPRPARTRRSLAAKLAFALVGLVTLVLLVNGGANLWLNYEDAKRAALDVQREKAKAAAERVDGFLSDVETQIGWTTRAEWRRVPVEQQRYDLIRLLRQAPAITEVSYLDSAGKEQLKVSRLEPDVVGSGKDFSGEPRFNEAVANRLWFGPVYFQRGSEPYMTVAIAHAGRNPGVTVAEVNLKLVYDVITAIKVGETGYAFVVTSAGRLIAHPDLSLVLRNTDLSQVPQVAHALSPSASASGAADRKPVTSEMVTDAAGHSVLSANATIGRVGWLVFVQSSVTEAMAPVYRSLFQTTALLGLGLVLAAIAGTFLSRRMVVPIRRLQEGAERLGGGDLSQRIAIRTGDEIETLADRFNQMAGRIQEGYETLEGKVEERTRDLNELLQQQTATSDVLKVISRSAFDLQIVLDTLVELAARLCEADKGVIFKRDGDVYRWSANFGNPPELAAFAKENPFRPGRHAVTSRVALEGRTFHVIDVLADPEYGATAYQKLGGYRTILGVPLLREGAPVGVFALTRDEVRSFTDKQIELVETFADQAGIAIENARLFEEVQSKTAEISELLQYQTATSDVLNVISRSPRNLQPVIDEIVATADRLCDPKFVLFFLRGDDGLYHIAASRNADQPFLDWLVAHPIAAGDGTATGLAAVERATVHLKDALNDPRFTDFVRQRRSQARTQLAVPLIRDDLVIGVVFLARTDVNPFTDKQVSLVTTFADQAVIAINNVRLFDEVQARTAELQRSLEYQTATSEVLGVIASSPTDVHPVLQAIVESACSLCEADDVLAALKDGDDLVFSAQHGSIPVVWQRQRINRDWTAGRAVLDRQPIHVRDLLAPEGADFPAAREFAEKAKVRTVLSVPLMREGESIGAIVLRRTIVQPFSEKQIQLLQTFADQAVIAIGNVTMFEQVQERTAQLQGSLEDLRTAQDRLVQTEKLASLGQLTAGIAHEIKNPLNFVNNFSALSAELIDELNDALKLAVIDDKIREEIDELTDLLKGNLDKVVQHGKRADSIVKNMLLHSREGSGEHRLADINGIVEESLNLAYHGARAEKPNFNITLQRDFDLEAGMIDLYPQEIMRVFLNLMTNGFYATSKRKEIGENGFEPILHVSTKSLGSRIEIRIRDNGTGIPPEVKEKMFNPFFTTKPAGEGTGLGLSMSHDIVVKQHHGTIDVTTEPGQFTEFVVTLPRSPAVKSISGGRQ